MGITTRLIANTSITFLFLATLAFAQGAQTGGITGVIKDPSGAVVRNAKVEIFNEETDKQERTVSTGEDGNFTVTLLTPGNYRLEISASGFKKSRILAVPVRLNETTRNDVELAVGGLEEVVQIDAAASVVNTVNPTTGQPIDSRTLSSLPLPVPNFLFLLTLSPGTAGDPPDVRAANRGMVDINVNGQRTSNNSVSLEGINVNDFNLAHFDTIPLPNPNTIQEFKVATSLYDASLGSKGGGALALVLKSGTKDLHGEAYWSHRNDALNANEYFRNASNSPRARLLQNVFGGSAGGPLWILGGNWFANYQGIRARNGIDPNGSSLNPLIQAFPTNPDGTTSAALLASAFSLTPAQIDPIAVNILNLRNSLYGGEFFIPRSGQPGCGTAGAAGTFQCTFSQVAPITDNQYTISYDRVMREGKDKISGRWFWDNGNSLRPYGTAGNLAFPQTSIQNNRFLSLNHTHIFNPSTVNEFRFGFSRFISSFVPNDPISLADIGATRPNEGDVPGMYFFTITGLFSAGTGVNDERATVSNTFHWADTLSLTKGRHTFRAGGDVTRYQLNRSNRFSIRGALTFGATSGDGNTFTAFQNFLQGRITGLQSAAGDPQRYFRATDVAAFFQDDWKITPRLTLNLGIRWEGMQFANDKFYRQNIYDPVLLAQGNNPFLFPEKVDLAGFTGTPGVTDCALKSCFDGNNFGPRIGFAWDVTGNQKTVVRGGYGVYYQRLSNQNILQGSLGPPFFVQLLNSQATPASFQLRDPLAGQPPTAAIATDFIPQVARFAGLQRIMGTGPLDVNDPNVVPVFVNEDGQVCNTVAALRGPANNCVITLASFTSVPFDAYTPYTQQFNLTVQRDLGRGWAVEAGYVGTRYVGGLGIWTPYLAQLASPSNPITVSDINGNSYSITTNTVNNEALRHQIIGLSRARGARFSGNIGQSTFHSGQFSVLRRFSRGLYLQAAYTWSKNIDNVSGSQSTDELNATRAGQAGANILNFGNDPQANRALGDFDRTHRFVVSYSWDLPVPKRAFFNNQVFQGWSISGIVTYQSGLPFSTLDSTAGGAFGTAGTNLGTGVFTCGSAEDAYTSGRIQDRLNAYVKASCFTPALTVPNGTTGATGYGTTPRNAFRGPFQQNWDFSVLKKFTFLEKHAISFRSDFFNLWNHPIFRSPSAINLATLSTFGQITETAIPARLIQFGLKYEF